ncbi:MULTISPECIES: hypothetical protein [unclassified Streptomyces]
MNVSPVRPADSRRRRRRLKHLAAPPGSAIVRHVRELAVGQAW